jgi:hypothetical protein
LGSGVDDQQEPESFDRQKRPPRATELLAHLRHGVRTSSRLAEQLVDDPQVGAEAATLLKRLRAVSQELELVEILRPELRLPNEGPLWRSQ